MAGAVATAAAQSQPSSHYEQVKQAFKAPATKFTATKLNPSREEQKKTTLKAIGDIESSNGKNFQHPVIPAGRYKGMTAYGHYGLMPDVIQERVSKSPELKAKHSAVLGHDWKTEHHKIYDYMQNNPDLEHHVASKLYDDFVRGIGTTNPVHVGFAWERGISGYHKHKNNGVDIEKMPYGQKMIHALKNPLK